MSLFTIYQYMYSMPVTHSYNLLSSSQHNTTISSLQIKNCKAEYSLSASHQNVKGELIWKEFINVSVGRRNPCIKMYQMHFIK